MVTRTLIQAAPTDGANWAQPLAKIVSRIGAPSDIPEQPNFQNNLDCNALTYRITGESQMRAGCFVSTAYGLLDPDSQAIIMNGTDEAVELKSFSNGEVLTPWQASGAMLALDSVNTGGMQLGLYGAAYESLITNRSLTGAISSKQFAHPPDKLIRFSDGSIVIINPQTMAFSANGAWLVAESYQGAFVRINLATLDVMPFAPSFAALGSPALLKSGVSITDSGRFVAIENSADNSLKVYDLQGCEVSIQTIKTRSCSSYDYKPFLTTSLGSISNITHVRFGREDYLTFNATVGNQSGRYALAPFATLPTLSSYLGLGDSFTSGEGTFNYQYDTDTDVNHCHLSVYAYPSVIQQALYSKNEAMSVACSGAVIRDIVPNQPSEYRGQIRGGIPAKQLASGYVEQVLSNYTPGILAQSAFVSQLQPKTITVSVGGNDIGFGSIITACVEPHISIRPAANDCYSTKEDRQELATLIDRTVPKWVRLYNELKKRSPASRLIVIGYPSLVSDQGNCGANVHLNQNEIRFANQVVTYLNARIASAAKQAGVSYIDVEHAFDGHRLCEATAPLVAVNGLTAGKDSGVFGIKMIGSESYHPNVLGQQLLAAAILKATHNFSEPPLQTPAATPSLTASAPVSGRQIWSIQPVDLTGPSIIMHGESIDIVIDGQDYGLEPRATYEVRLNSAEGPVIGSVTGAQDGTISAKVIIPDIAASGVADIHIVSRTFANTEIVDIVTQHIYIPATTTDADGDGILDSQDSCPYGTNALIDADNDTIDDSCDPSIDVEQSNRAQVASVTTDTPLLVSHTKASKPLINVEQSSCQQCAKILGATTASAQHHVVRRKLLVIPFIAWTLIPLISIWVIIVMSYLIGKGINILRRM